MVTNPKTVDQMSQDEVNEALNATFPEPDLSKWNKASGGGEDVWDFEVKGNEVIQGIYIDVRQDIGTYRSNMYIIQVPDLSGKPWGVWGCTALDKAFFSDAGTNSHGTAEHAKIPLGAKVYIKFMGYGQRKGGKNAPKLFDIYWDK
jgi:hypothetical protein